MNSTGNGECAPIARENNTTPLMIWPFGTQHVLSKRLVWLVIRGPHAIQYNNVECLGMDKVITRTNGILTRIATGDNIIGLIPWMVYGM